MQNFTSLVQSKIGLSLARKALKSGQIKENDLQWQAQRFAREAALTSTNHFEDRIAQRFLADEIDSLAAAVARAVRGTKTREVGSYGDHSRVSQRYEDALTGIVVVLERYGNLGATLVTTYKKGCENLISDEELADLKKRGVL